MSTFQRSFLLTLICVFTSPVVWAQFEKITFRAADDLEVTADYYEANSDLATPIILLFHQAGSSRGEYRTIAPRLKELGFNCLAVDQRSGSSRNGVSNETASRAKAMGLGQSFLDAVPDLKAAIALAKSEYSSGPVIIWGSSYSSALVLKLSGDEPTIADGVLAFSPGEYFRAQGRTFIGDAAAGILVPTFITSAKSEAGDWSRIFEAIPAEGKTSFLPPSGGRHGSSTLLDSVTESELYWSAVEDFLQQWLPVSGGSPLQLGEDSSGKLTLGFDGEIGAKYLLSVSDDLERWIPLTSLNGTGNRQLLHTFTEELGDNLFYRLEPGDDPPEVEVTNVTASGQPGSYQFQVTIKSTELGWEQYADWWEVLDESGELLYRRVLAHPHVNEQPFTRSGGPVEISADQMVWIRCHLNNGGYGRKAFKGSVANGFKAAELDPFFGHAAAVQTPLPVD